MCPLSTKNNYRSQHIAHRQSTHGTSAVRSSRCAMRQTSQSLPSMTGRDDGACAGVSIIGGSIAVRVCVCVTQFGAMGAHAVAHCSQKLNAAVAVIVEAA